MNSLGTASKILSLFLLASLIFVVGPGSSRTSGVQAPQTGTTGEAITDVAVSSEGDVSLLQFIAGGHIVAFRSSGAWIASGDHMLSVKFVSGCAAPPISDTPASQSAKAPPLSTVTYRDLWEGISLVYESVPDGVLETSYMLEPGARAGDIRLEYNRPPQLSADGGLVFEFESGRMAESAPAAWQEIDGLRQPVSVAFELNPGGEVGFALGAYDPNLPLVIDPVIRWTTFLGDSSSDLARSIAINGDSDAFVTGRSEGPWHTGMAPKRSYSDGEDAYVAKLDSYGNLEWYTFLGGDNDDEGFDIIYRTSGYVIVIGESRSAWGTGPVRAYQGGYDAFLAQISTTTGLLDWHTFLGGTGNDYGRSIANDGSFVVAAGYSGATWNNGSTNPVNAFSGGFDAFVARFDHLGGMYWHTFLGSTASDRGMGITTDGISVYLVGYSNATWGTDTSRRNYSGGNDGFIAKLESDGDFVWRAFLGSSSDDYAYSVDLDASGNVYVVGRSHESWIGSTAPMRAFSGGWDAFVVKFTSSGLMQWNTFLGSSESDDGWDVYVEDGQHIYVVGSSDGSWESPFDPHSGGTDAYLAMLNSAGNLQWNNFFGSDYDDDGYGLAVNNSGLPHIVGESFGAWGDPVHDYAGYDGFVARISIDGDLIWNTFQGGASEDGGRAIDLDSDGNIFVAGYSQSTWGSNPKRAHQDEFDAFLAKLNPQGELVWHTFLGGDEDDKAYGIAVNSSGYIFVTGESEASWGSPKRGYTGGQDAFVAKVSNSGTLQWNTFLGSASTDIGYDVDLYSSGNIDVVGVSYATWGTPVHAYSLHSDAFVAEISDAGILQWHTFVGGQGSDDGRALVVDNIGNIYMVGKATYTWGSPIRSHSGTNVSNAMVVKLNTSGSYLWHTFLGGYGDYGLGIARDGSGNLYVVGTSDGSWYFPIRACTSNQDAFVAKLEYDGDLVWNTCLGVNNGLTWDGGYGIATTKAGDSYVVGYSRGNWSAPVTISPYSEDSDAFLAKVESDGDLAWNAFFGAADDDTGYGVALGPGERVLVTGAAFGEFGDAVNPSRGEDAFVVEVGNAYIYLPLVMKH